MFQIFVIRFWGPNIIQIGLRFLIWWKSWSVDSCIFKPKTWNMSYGHIVRVGSQTIEWFLTIKSFDKRIKSSIINELDSSLKNSFQRLTFFFDSVPIKSETKEIWSPKWKNSKFDNFRTIVWGSKKLIISRCNSCGKL